MEYGIYSVGLVASYSQRIATRKDGSAYHVEQIALTSGEKTWFVANYSDNVEQRAPLKFGDKIKVIVESSRTDEKRNIYLSGPYTLLK